MSDLTVQVATTQLSASVSSVEISPVESVANIAAAIEAEQKSVSVSSPAITVTISGLTVTLSWMKENLTSLVDGANKVFPATDTPAANSLFVWYQNMIMLEDIDYTLVGDTVTFSTAPRAGRTVYFQYQKA